MRIYFFDICEVARIDVFGADGIKPVFVSDEAYRYFVSSPLEWSFETVIGENILKRGDN